MDGWVYILTNESMPGLIKVGHSTKDPSIRSSELFQTGTPTPFKVQYSAFVNNPQTIEFSAHKILKQYRVNPNREFFRCSIWDAVKAIESISKPLIVHNYAAELEELREKQERKEIREEFIKRELEPFVKWQQQELQKIANQRAAMLNIPYLYHFYGWLLVVGMLTGVPALASNDAFLVIVLFSGPLFTKSYHVSLIEKSDKYKQFDLLAHKINTKVSEKLLLLEREAEDEWGD